MRKIYFLAAGILLLNFLNNNTYGSTPKNTTDEHPKGVYDLGFNNSHAFFELMPIGTFVPIAHLAPQKVSQSFQILIVEQGILPDTNSTAKTTSSTNGAIPVINTSSTSLLTKGDSIFLSASPSAGYNYQWAYNGTNIAGATNANYFAKNAGAYTVSITSSAHTTKSSVTVISSAPDVIATTPQFDITTKDLTCRDSNNGVIHVSSSLKLNFTAVLSNKSTNARYNFNDTLIINHLPAGDYSLAIKTDDSLINKSFPVKITEPAILSVSTIINQDKSTLQVKLAGASAYIVNIGGVEYKTNENSITVPITVGSNKLLVTSDISCQIPVEKVIDYYASIVPYPNPVINLLNINIGNNTINNIDISITNLLTGKPVYSKQYYNRAGVLQPDLSQLPAGLYSLTLHLDSRELVYKIIKK